MFEAKRQRLLQRHGRQLKDFVCRPSGMTGSQTRRNERTAIAPCCWSSPVAVGRGHRAEQSCSGVRCLSKPSPHAAATPYPLSFVASARRSSASQHERSL